MTKKPTISLKIFAWGMVFLVGIVLSMKTLHEPDLWWQLRTGDYILEHGQVPDADFLSFTYKGEPWINVKWGFEVLMAAVVKLGGPELIYLLQICATILMGVFVGRLYRVISDWKGNILSPSAILGILIMLFAITFRLNGRPEMVSHVFAIGFVWLLFRNRKKQDYWLLLLIPLQAIWVNLHEGYGIGLVVMGLFIAGAWLEFFIQKTYRIKYPAMLTGVALLAYLSVAIHPFGTTMYTHFMEIYHQLGANQYTKELFSFTQREYWTFPAYMNMLVLALAMWQLVATMQKSLKHLIQHYGVGFLLVFFAFLYLSFSAQRNIPFFVLVATPLVIERLQKLLAGFKWYESNATYVTASVLVLGLYLSIVTNVFYDKLLPREQFGLGIKYEKTPIGAAHFLKEHQIGGKGFVDYLSSSYLLWELKPGYRSYIDLRDLDIFPQTFFDNVFRLYNNPTAQLGNGTYLWDYVNSFDEFNYVLLLNGKNFHNLHRHLVHHDPNYELVYADPLASIYLRANAANRKLIDQYGFNNGKRNVFHPYQTKEVSALAMGFNKLFCPWYTVPEVKEVKALEKEYYQMLGYPNLP